MLTHAKSGHWYLSQAWAKALQETPLSRANCGQSGRTEIVGGVSPDTDGHGHLRLGTQSQADQVTSVMGPRKGV